MATARNVFVKSKMNKDLDDRLIGKGEYRSNTKRHKCPKGERLEQFKQDLKKVVRPLEAKEIEAKEKAKASKAAEKPQAEAQKKESKPSKDSKTRK